MKKIWFVLATALSATACSDVASSPSRRVSTGEPSRTLAASIKRGRGIEDHFLNIEMNHPGFGGFFMDSVGNVEYYVTDTAQATATEAAVLQSLNANTDVFQRGRVVKLIKRLGQYSFSQLVDWQGRIGHGSNLEDEITLLDADESLNRVHLYVRSSDALSRVAALADRVGVPPEAIVAQVHDWHIHTTADSTRGVVRPTSGGLEISHPDSVIFNGVHAYGNVVCSLGYNVTVNGVDYLLTAAHCNKHHYLGTTGDPMYQPDSARAPTPIGTTAINPAWASSPLCSGYQYCNDVDAMLVQYGSTAHNKTVIQTTTIGVGTAGSRTIGSYLSLAIPSPLERMQGDSVYKTGYWTGTTGGTVGGSCTQAPDKSGYFLVWCTNFAVLYNDGGDSGGPVFYFKFPLALDVRMPEGISWGQATDLSGHSVTLYSTWSQIQTNLGNITMIPY